MSLTDADYHLVEFTNGDQQMLLKCHCGWTSKTANHVDPDVLKKYALGLESRHLRLVSK